MSESGLESKSLRLEPHYLVCVLAPTEDAERIMAHVAKLSPLAIGRYDRNAFQSAAGTEHYRPLEGAPAGAEHEVRHRQGVVELSFQLPLDRDLLCRIAETVYEVHSYQEPLIMVSEILASRTKGLDDRNNPHRWWNTTGDWKKSSSSNA